MAQLLSDEWIAGAAELGAVDLCKRREGAAEKSQAENKKTRSGGFRHCHQGESLRMFRCIHGYFGRSL